MHERDKKINDRKKNIHKRGPYEFIEPKCIAQFGPSVDSFP